MTRELYELVEIAPEAGRELARPGQSDEGDARRRVASPQRPQRRDRAQEVAELEGTQDRDLHFSRMNRPMASASIGEVKKHSTASRGEHTIGSLRVLNEVFTSTGTPVRAWNARRRS